MNIIIYINITMNFTNSTDNWTMLMHKYFSPPRETLKDLIEKKNMLLIELETVEKIIRNLSRRNINLLDSNIIKRRIDLNNQLDKLEQRMRGLKSDKK